MITINIVIRDDTAQTTATDCISMVCSFTTTTTATQAMMSDLQKKNYYKLDILNKTDKKIQNETDLYSQ